MTIDILEKHFNTVHYNKLFSSLLHKSAIKLGDPT